MQKLIYLLLWFLPTSIYAHTDLAGIIKQVKPGIVGIGVHSAMAQKNILAGTGFVIGNGQYVVTNYHLITLKAKAKAMDKLVIFTGSGRNGDIYNVEVLASSEKYDLAVLKHNGPKLPALALSDDTYQDEGRQIAFTGFPIGAVLGLYPVTHQGMISSITPIIIPAKNSKAISVEMIKALRDPFLIYQLDAVAYPGNSGSPVYLQDNGEVVAILNKVLVSSSKESAIENPSGIAYAIPIRFLIKLLTDSGINIQP